MESMLISYVLVLPTVCGIDLCELPILFFASALCLGRLCEKPGCDGVLVDNIVHFGEALPSRDLNNVCACKCRTVVRI